MVNLGDDLSADLAEVVGSVESKDPLHAMRALIGTLEHLQKFERLEDEKINDLMHVLSSGGIFSSDIQDEFAKSAALLGEIHLSISSLENLDADATLSADERAKRRAELTERIERQFGALKKRENKLIQLLEAEQKSAAELAKFVRGYKDQDMKLLNLVNDYHALMKAKKLPMAAFAGNPEFVTTSLLGGIKMSVELFDLIEQVLLTRFRNSSRRYIDSVETYLHLWEDVRGGRADLHTVFAHEHALYVDLMNERHDALLIVRDASAKLRDEHKYFRSGGKEIAHLVSLLGIGVRRINSAQKQHWN